LAVRRASPALLARRVTRDTEGNVIEVAKAIYRGDRYRMVFVRER
jgi:DNA-binding GntR family transcriptional regulator